MGRNRFVAPETVQIDIGDGDWIEVKKRLTIGELRKSQTSAIKTVQGFGAEARYTPDTDVLGKAEVFAYLVDWSLTSPVKETQPDGAIVIKHVKVKIDTDDKRKSAIDNLDPDDFEIISKAITQHVEKMEAERAAEKNARAGETPSSAISPSVVQ